ncbi:MAG: phage integrase N-terminal SAM-like domain-containing protein [Dechloromonas sp.]|nr:phage integrase N-terminal SAM-like domain-containing protein [Dechloromonas sp.]
MQPPVTLLERVREAIRYKHHSIRTERAYVEWVRRFVLSHGRRQPRDMGACPLARGSVGAIDKGLPAVTASWYPWTRRSMVSVPSRGDLWSEWSVNLSRHRRLMGREADRLCLAEARILVSRTTRDMSPETLLCGGVVSLELRGRCARGVRDCRHNPSHFPQ